MSNDKIVKVCKGRQITSIVYLTGPTCMSYPASALLFRNELNVENISCSFVSAKEALLQFLGAIDFKHRGSYSLSPLDAKDIHSVGQLLPGQAYPILYYFISRRVLLLTAKQSVKILPE